MLNGTMGLFRGTNFDLAFLRSLVKDDVSKQSHNTIRHPIGPSQETVTWYKKHLAGR